MSEPVEEILGKRTLWVTTAPERVESYILNTDTDDLDTKQGTLQRGLDRYTILAESSLLNVDQILVLQNLVFNPQAYEHNDEFVVFRRFPPGDDFAFRLIRENCILDLIVGLRNPGWTFLCEDEHYRYWNLVGREFRSLAKSLFPQLANPNPGFAWRKGVIKELRAAKKLTNRGNE